uniref:Uncharacterized protein n=1 Tax=Vitis vinifera TaxID=29760 RepID=A5BE10_VITVI|nr:hypothetical protein VITISV_021524 [Vitis vinifera]
MSHLHFATVGHIFEALPGAQIMYTISCFKSWEVRSPELQTVHNLELKQRSYGHLKTSAQSLAGISQPRHHLEGCFAAVKPLFGTRVPFSSTVPLILKLRYSCEITFELRNGYEMISKLRNGCEITSKHRNGLQIAKLTCEMEEEPIAPAKETMPPKETTRTEAKVLIQPIQEATTDTSAPHDLTIT